MVEKDGELHVVLYTPPSQFDVAVILRTLYTGLGADSGWTLHVVGMGKRIPVRTIVDSRVPIPVALEKVYTSEPDYAGACTAIVDGKGRPAWELNVKPSILVVDYAASYRSHVEDKANCVVHVKGLGLPSLTYEAIAVIYELAIRGRYSGVRGKAVYPSVREAIYLARKFAEAITVFDNYTVLEPNTVSYVLRKLYQARGVILDPARYEVRVDPVRGTAIEVIELRAYDRRLREKGAVKVIVDATSITVEDWGGVRYRLILDRARRRVCIASDTCFSRVEGGSEQSYSGLMIIS